MQLIVLWIGKLTFIFLNIFKKSGSALPGLVVERISPNFMSKHLKTLPDGVVVVTGTNGKTTTTKIISHLLSGDKKVLTNPSGSNFTRGVVSTIVKHAKWNGILDFDIAIIELDEAYAVKFVEKFSPDYSVILNIMRDQMDRFGEIDKTAKLLSKVVNKTTKITILNADDARVSKLAESANCGVSFFGVSKDLRKVLINDDELHGKNISSRNVKVEAELISLDKNILKIDLNGRREEFVFNLNGLHNAQNACASILLANHLGISVDKITSRLSSVEPAFGRGETIQINEQKVILQLVKNPGGFRQSLITGSKIKADKTLLVINDNYADGRDVSWLWDVEFKGYLNGDISTAGSRGYDMNLRLTYDEINVEQTYQTLESALAEELKKIPKTGTLIIYTTYTAMLELRKILAKYTEVYRV